MIRYLWVLGSALVAVHPAQAQFFWNGPFNGSTNWTAGNWSPSVPPTGGSPATTLTFNQIGTSASYTALNDLGNPFQLSTLNLNSLGGGITVGSAAGNMLEFGSGSVITQNGVGNAIISSTFSLSGGGTTTIAGTNFGNLQLSGIISGNGSLTINRPQNQFFTGTVDLGSAINPLNYTFTGGVDLQAGNLRLGFGSVLGSGTLRVTGGTLGATRSGVFVTNNIVLTGTDLVFSGAVDGSGIGGQTFMTLGGVISENGVSGLTVSSVEDSVLILQGANTYTGETKVVVNPRPSTFFPRGALYFSGANGSANLSSQFTINGGGSLTLDNGATGTNNNNRIGDNAAVNISGLLQIHGANGGATLENIGAVTSHGFGSLYVNAGVTGNTGTTLQADSLNRINRGQFRLSGNNINFGRPLGANVANLIFDIAPTLSGGGGAAGTTTISIIPYAVGGTGVSSGGLDELVTYGVNGIRPLSTVANEYVTSIASGSTTLNNAKIGSSQFISAPTQINALVVNGGMIDGNSTLTVASGTVVLNGINGGLFLNSPMTLAFGASEGAIFVNSQGLNTRVAGRLTGSNGLTKGGVGTLELLNVNNNVTGPLTLNNGLISFANSAVLDSFSNIVVNGGAGLTNSLGNVTVSKPMLVTDGYVQFSSGGTLTYSGQISGAGGVEISSGDVELTNTINSYTGQTRVVNSGFSFLSRNLIVSGDNVLGNGGGVDIAGTSSSGLRLSGNWTTSRQINFSNSAQVDTNGFDWTINSPLTSTNLDPVVGTVTINKVGAGIWTLTQGGSLGQSAFSGGTTTATLNVQAGELRATNPSGSATGRALVNINGTSIISGTGAFGGATTVANTAFVRPGVGGTSVGTLNFNSTMIVNGMLSVDGAGPTADRIDVLGAVTLGSSSVLALAGTYDPNTTFTLMNYASVTGTFSIVNGLPTSHNLVYGATNLQLVPVPEPTVILAVAGLGLVIGQRVRRKWRARGFPIVQAAAR